MWPAGRSCCLACNWSARRLDLSTVVLFMQQASAACANAHDYEHGMECWTALETCILVRAPAQWFSTGSLERSISNEEALQELYFVRQVLAKLRCLLGCFCKAFDFTSIPGICRRCSCPSLRVSVLVIKRNSVPFCCFRPCPPHRFEVSFGRECQLKS